MVSRLLARIPFLRSLRGYSRTDAAADGTTAVLITAAAIPLGMGFASAAGLPPQVGLYTSIVPLIVFGLAGSTRHVKLGLDAAAAAMIGSAVVPLAVVGGAVDQSRLLALVAVVTALTGVILLIAGLARAGFLADLLSLPLLTGYQAGIALSVIIGQSPKLLGVQVAGANDLARAWNTVGAAATTNLPTLVLGAAALGLLIAGRVYFPRAPISLIVLAAGTASSAALDLTARGVAVVGRIPVGLPTIALPDFALAAGQWGTLVGTSASLALVVASDVVIASRTFAARGHYRVSANTDVAALGLAQIAGACCGAVTASASYARSAIAERSRSRTQVSSVLAGLVMIVVVTTMTELLAALPIAILAAVCVDACWRLIDAPAFARLWRLRRSEAVIAVVTGVLVLATDPLIAIGVAVAFSILAFLKRTMWPAGGRLGERRGIDGWFALSEYADARVETPHVLVYRWNAPLIFANADALRQRVARAADDDVRDVVLDCSAVSDVDASAADMLQTLSRELADRGVRLLFAGPTGDVVRMLGAVGLLGQGEGPRAFVDVTTAMAVATDRTGTRLLADPDGNGVFEFVHRDGERADDGNDPGR